MSGPRPEDLLMGQIDRVLAKRKDGSRPACRYYKVRVQNSATMLIRDAAARREMSVSAYLRRAGIAFAAYDLGLDLAELLKDEPPTRLKYDGPRADRTEAGEGHGRWRIGGLV